MADAAAILLSVFKCTIPSIKYIFKNGKEAAFVQGVFRTAVQSEIDELTNEVSLGHPHIFIDPAEQTIASDMIDPMAQLRAKIIAEHMASLATATNPENDMGSTAQEAVKPSNTQDIAEGAAGGSGSNLAARLVNLGKANG